LPNLFDMRTRLSSEDRNVLGQYIAWIDRVYTIEWVHMLSVIVEIELNLYERWRVYNSSQSMILQSMIPWMLIVI